MNSDELDGLITGMQTAKMQMETIKMNCSVINQVVSQLKKQSRMMFIRDKKLLLILIIYLTFLIQLYFSLLYLRKK